MDEPYAGAMVGGRGVWRHRARVAEALVLLALAHLARSWVAMRRWSRVLGPNGPAVVGIEPGGLSGVEADVALAVEAGARRLGANCLEQAVAGSVMLRRRGRPGVVVIGLDVANPAQVPHAWLVGASGRVVVGGGPGGHRPVNQFGRSRPDVH